jgi:hypothetical protein
MHNNFRIAECDDLGDVRSVRLYVVGCSVRRYRVMQFCSARLLVVCPRRSDIRYYHYIFQTIMNTKLSVISIFKRFHLGHSPGFSLSKENSRIFSIEYSGESTDCCKSPIPMESLP